MYSDIHSYLCDPSNHLCHALYKCFDWSSITYVTLWQYMHYDDRIWRLDHYPTPGSNTGSKLRQLPYTGLNTGDTLSP